MSWTKHWIGLARCHKDLGDRAAKPVKPRTGGKPLPAETVALIKRDLAVMPYQAVAAAYGVTIHSVRNIARGTTRADVQAAPSIGEV